MHRTPAAAAPGTSSLANDVLIEPVLPGEKRKQEELRRKLEDKRERRKIEKKLKEVKSLGEVDDEDDSAAAWAKKLCGSRGIAPPPPPLFLCIISCPCLCCTDHHACPRSPPCSKKIQKQKKLAAAREQALAEEDDAVEQAAEYGTADLAGLQVLHDKDLLQEGTTILTLADTGVLDDEDDKLENVEISAEERRHENEEKRKKGLDEYVLLWLVQSFFFQVLIRIQTSIRRYKGYDDDEFSDPSKARGAPNLLKKCAIAAQSYRYFRVVDADLSLCLGAGTTILTSSPATRRKGRGLASRSTLRAAPTSLGNGRPRRFVRSSRKKSCPWIMRWL